LFEMQARRRPDSLAVADWQRHLSYAELDRRSNQLAAYLRRSGAAPEQLVALCLERSVEMVVAILAIWKTGSTYVPVDILQPQTRLALLLEDIGAVAVLSTASSMAATGGLGGYQGRIILLDAQQAEIRNESEETHNVEVSAGQLAYVIYTSGTTGKPKGVMIKHGSVTNLARALEEAIYSEQERLDGSPLRVSLNAPLVFDASVKQLVQLAYGRTLVIIPEEVRRDGELLLEHLKDQAIEVFDCTPSHMRLLLEAGLRQTADSSPKERGSLQAVLVGGEAIDQPLWEELAAHSRITYYNVYGPTECTVDATAQRLGMDHRVSIGTPLGNTETYVLDEQMRLAPTGVTGEIYIGGEGLARGYRGSAELTGGRFVPHPFSERAGARLYRTGDVGRNRIDGRLECLGRADRQVKVRGYRIELGEVEAVLREHAAIGEVAVMARAGESGSNCLVAYIVPHQRYSARLEGRQRYQLPNGMAILHQSKADTDALYDEIFEQHVYFRHGIMLADDACILDVGANIGMFSLYITQHYPQARIYAFEPLEPI
jgi:amino acid adenylation domain-containing protein